MICSVCHQKATAIHMTSVVNGKKSEMALCLDCAREKGFVIQSPAAASSSGFTWGGLDLSSVSDVISHLLEDDTPGENAPDHCPHCSLTEADFRSRGRFGCAHCYTSFAPQVQSLLPRIHGYPQHRGKVYAPPSTAKAAPAGSNSVKTHERHLLETQLKAAVESEDYERAAQLRDQLRRLCAEPL